MRNYIILNGKNSNTIQGLIIQSLAPITKPMIRTQVEEIDGRDGDIVTPLGYSSYDKTITIGLYGNYDVNEVIEYFNSNGIVTFSNEPDKYYKYQINAQIDFERLIRFKTATVTMHCQPFKYSTTEQPEIMSPSDELLTIPDWQQITNGVTLSCIDGVISLSGTPTSATEFYLPITALALQAGSYTLTASANGQNPNNCSIRMIGTAPSDADSFGNRYISLVQGTTSVSATLAASKTFNYIWFYMSAGATVGLTLTLSVEESSKVTSAEGTNIVLENTAETHLNSIDFKGNINQTTYSGKNLVHLASGSSHGVTGTVNANGSVAVSGTADVTDGISIAKDENIAIPAGTYTLSISHSLDFLINLSIKYGTVAKPFRIPAGETSVTATLPSAATEAVLYIGANSGQTYNDTFKIQLVAGSNPDWEFEPFVGGAASPNPIGYPQDVQVVTGQQKVRIAGKNLARLSGETNDGVTGTVNADGSITVTGTATATGGVKIAHLYSPVIPSGTYTLTIDNALDHVLNFVVSCGEDNVPFRIPAGETSVTRTLPSAATSTALYVVITYGKSYNELFKLQLVKGVSADYEFEPYQAQEYTINLGSTELCKIGDSQDYFYKQDDNWYIHKEIAKLDMSTITSWSDSSAGKIYRSNFVSAYGIKRDPLLSNLFIYSTTTWEDFKFGITSSNNLWISTGDSSINSGNVRTWLQNKGAVLYGALTTPTNTQITDTDLITQLENIRSQAHAYRQRTHIDAVAQGGNASLIITATALASADGTVTNSGNIYSKPKLTIFGSGDIAVYLNNVQMFQIALGDNEYITIDTAALEAYKDTTETLMNRLVTGDYQNFKFQVGDNTLTFSGTVTECVVENYSRWL